MYVTEGLGLDLDFSKTIPELDDMGQLLQVAGGTAAGCSVVADLADFEDANNPTGDEENVNPNSVLTTGRGQVVSDAGANDLLLVSSRTGTSPSWRRSPTAWSTHRRSSGSRRAPRSRWTPCRPR